MELSLQHILVFVPFGGGGPTPDYVSQQVSHPSPGGYTIAVGSDSRFGPSVLQGHPLFREFMMSHRGIRTSYYVDVSPEYIAHLYGITPEGSPKNHPGGLTYKEFQDMWRTRDSDPEPIRRFLDGVRGHPWDPRKRWPGIDGTLPGQMHFGRNMLDVLVMAEHVKEAIFDVLRRGFVPVTIGGDHSVNLGVMAGIAKFFAGQLADPTAEWVRRSPWRIPEKLIQIEDASQVMRKLLDLTWPDAHPDAHTLADSGTGNIHGMPVAAALGMGSEGAGGSILADLGGVRGKIDPRKLAFFGLRDVDTAEQTLLDQNDITWHMSAAILAGGFDIGAAIREHLGRNPGGFSVFSADLDGLDPTVAPGVTTAVGGGLTLEHYLAILRGLHAHRGRDCVLSYEVHEFNPRCLLPDGKTLLRDGEVDQTVKTMIALLDEIVRKKPLALRVLSRGIELPTGFQKLEEVSSEGDSHLILLGADSRNFYVMRGNEVALYLNGKRIPIKNPRPGVLIRILGETAEAVRVEDLHDGDLVVAKDSQGLVTLQDPSAKGGLDFGFMGTQITPERFDAAQAIRVAQVMMRAREEGKKIAIVGGPAITHSDGGKYIAALIKAGWVQVLSAGNALATHDLELNHVDFGTSLGSSPELEAMGLPRAVPGGEQHHLRLINEARGMGSLEELVRSGKIGERSVIRAAIEEKIEMILCGSDRDDGPLPGVISDIEEANQTLAKSLEGAGVLINLATYLHSSAALERVPASVAKVIGDVNMDVVANLQGLNPLNSDSINANAASFLKNLCEALGVAVDHLATPTPLGIIGWENLRSEGGKIGNPDQPAQLAVVTQDGVAPEGFTTTTNEPTEINLGGENRVQVAGIKMDGVFVVDPEQGTAKVKVFRQLRRGDHVIVGRDGIKRTPLTGSHTPRTIPDLANKMRELRAAKKNILLVASSALVSSEATQEVKSLMDEGYITRLYCGLALPLFEVEKALFGTVGDFENKVRALYEIRRRGGLEGNAFEELAPNGVIAAAKRKGIPIVVSASPNDTGVIQGVLTNKAETQDRVRKMYHEGELVLMTGTVLHSIAAGNLGPGTVPVIIIDPSKFAIQKLADRGTVQAHGVQASAKDFFRDLNAALEFV